MPTVFICYRREDTAPYAGWLRQALTTAFGKDRVFMDIDAIAPGVDFDEVIQSTLERVDVVLVLIGPRWISAQDAGGERRLDDPDDYIRLEIASGLKRKIRVVPVLVGGAVVPKRDQLPDDIRALVRRQAAELTDSRWDYDTSRLIDSLKTIDSGVPPGRVDPPAIPSLPPQLDGTTVSATVASDAVVTQPPSPVAAATMPIEVEEEAIPPPSVGPAGLSTGAVAVDPLLSETPGLNAAPTTHVSATVPPAPGDATVRSFASLIGVEGASINWRAAAVFLVATTIGSVGAALANAFYLSQVYRGVSWGDLFSASFLPSIAVSAMRAVVVLTSFRFFRPTVASIVVGVTTAAVFAMSRIDGARIMATLFGTTTLYLLASWSVRKFPLLVAGIGSGAVASLASTLAAAITLVLLTGEGLSSGWDTGQLMQGFVLGIALMIAKRMSRPAPMPQGHSTAH